jgi:MoxR-like ATPase
MSQSSAGQELLDPEQIEPAQTLAHRVLEEMDRRLLGQSELHRLVLVGLLSRGHILLEGLPGVGKTALIHGLGQLLQLTFNRVQFTPDLMPGDILGATILQEDDSGQRQMMFQPGPIFANLVLADEINRASPKTQSALLEAMQDRQVTTMGTTRELPSPFFVLASQNPIELEGTYPLPEAQLDRFLFKLNVTTADAATLDQIIYARRRGQPPEPEWTLSAEQLDTLFDTLDAIVLPRSVSRYIARLVAATHPTGDEAPEAVQQYVSYGASPRAAIGMAEAARAQALLEGRPTVGFEDVKHVAAPVLNHRLILSYQARFDQVDQTTLIHQLLDSLDETGLDLPADMQVESGQR